jgi:hypothetical protein
MEQDEVELEELPRVMIEPLPTECVGKVDVVEGDDLGLDALDENVLPECCHGGIEQAVNDFLRDFIPGAIEGSDHPFGSVGKKIDVSDGTRAVHGYITGERPAQNERTEYSLYFPVIPSQFRFPGKQFVIQKDADEPGIRCVEGDEIHIRHRAVKSAWAWWMRFTDS